MVTAKFPTHGISHGKTGHSVWDEIQGGLAGMNNLLQSTNSAVARAAQFAIA
jgi:hypothetical protein